jgi:AraC-like DNA-binding protein
MCLNDINQKLRNEFQNNFYWSRLSEQQLNLLLLTLTSGILMAVFGNSPEIIFRHQVRIVSNYNDHKKNRQKIEQFIGDICSILHQHQDNKNQTLEIRIQEFIKTCPSSKLPLLTVQYIADAFGFSRNHVSEKYRNHFGTPLKNAILTEKLERAYNYQSDNKQRMTARSLAEHVGFLDSGYFSKLFKKRFGVPPGQIPYET